MDLSPGFTVEATKTKVYLCIMQEHLKYLLLVYTASPLISSSKQSVIMSYTFFLVFHVKAK